MNNKGYTTVFFTLIISVLLLFTFTALEAVKIHMGRVKMLSCVHSMRSSILADYHNMLFERYHLLFMDPTYGTGSAALAEEKMQDYLEVSLNGEKDTNLYTFTVEEIALVDKKDILWKNLSQVKEQVAEYEKAAGALNRIKEVAEKLKENTSDIESAAGETERNGVEIPVSDEDTQKNHVEEQQGPEEKPETEDPRETLKEALKFGILSVVMPGNAISKKEQDFSMSPSAAYEKEQDKIKDNCFQDISFLKSFLKESAGDNDIHPLVQQAAFADYAGSNFSHATEQIPDCVMQCEVEYILKGKSCDYDNLQAVVDEIIWLRMPVNYAYLLTDTEKKSEALTVAAGICTATGTPALMEVVKYLLLGCWAYGETLCEMKALLAGEEIAYCKTKENWNTQLKSLLSGNQTKKVKTGLSYEEYLIILLAGKRGKALDGCYARMLDLMELNIRKEDPAFCITNCVGEMTVQGQIQVDPFFVNEGSAEVYHYYFEENLAY